MAEFEVRAVEADEVRGLRRALLRPHQQIEELIYPGDDHPQALHLGGFRHGRMVGIATITPRPMPGNPERAAWQVRGMAVDHGHRGYGLGGMLLRACLEHAAGHGGRLAWCNARAGSFGFYERYGFRRDGDPFELPDVGPHYRMCALIGAGRDDRPTAPGGVGNAGRSADRPGDTSASPPPSEDQLTDLRARWSGLESPPVPG